MAGKTTPTEDGQQAPEAPATAVQVVCEVLINGMEYNDAHHAIGKRLTMSRHAADIYLQMSPPQLKLVGVVE